jgi:hypothetical protein
VPTPPAIAIFGRAVLVLTVGGVTGRGGVVCRISAGETDRTEDRSECHPAAEECGGREIPARLRCSTVLWVVWLRDALG